MSSDRSVTQDTNSAPIRIPATGDDEINLFDDSTYPLCNVASHFHNRSTSTSFPRIVPHDDAALSPTSLSRPATPPSSLPAPFHVDECLGTVPPLDNSDPTRESIRVPVTSLNQATADAMRDAATLGITTPLPTPEIVNPSHYSFLPPFPLPFPLCTAQTPSCLPVNQTPHLRPLLTRLSTKCFIQIRRFRPRIRLTSDILIIRSSYHFSSTSPGLISATDWGATPEERGSLMYSLCEAKDARHYPVVNRVTRVGTMTTPDPRAPVTGHRLRPSHRELFTAGTLLPGVRRPSSARFALFG